MTRGILLQISPRDVKSGFEDERRQENGENQRAGKLQFGERADGGQSHASDDEADGVRQVNSPGQHGHHSGDKKEQFDGGNVKSDGHDDLGYL